MHKTNTQFRNRLVLLIWCCWCLGCSSNEPSAAITKSQTLLRRGEYQAALDQLYQDTSAHSHYLQAVSLSYLGKNDAAQEQIEIALAGDEDNLTYQVFQLRLKLLKTDPQAVTDLIAIHNAHPSSAAACLCAFYAYEIQATIYSKQQQGKKANVAHKTAKTALESAATLSEQIPEFQREIFKLALAMRLPKAVDNLAQKLQKVAPDDPTLAQERIATLMLTDPDQAIAEARKQYLLDNKSESAALAYATSLAGSVANQQHDSEFEMLFAAFPGHADIVAKYSAYLARTGRTQTAMEVFQKGIGNQKTDLGKKHLMRLAIFVALESNEAELAKSALGKYRETLKDPLLVAYFEGRLLYLQKDHAAAIAKLRHVVETQKDAVGTGRKLAQESLQWIMKILADDAVKKQLEKTNEVLKSNGDAKSNQESDKDVSLPKSGSSG